MGNKKETSYDSAVVQRRKRITGPRTCKSTSSGKGPWPNSGKSGAISAITGKCGVFYAIAGKGGIWPGILTTFGIGTSHEIRSDKLLKKMRRKNMITSS